MVRSKGVDSWKTNFLCLKEWKARWQALGEGEDEGEGGEVWVVGGEWPS